MEVLFDANVVLDVYLDRAPWVTDSKAAFQLVLDGKIEGLRGTIFGVGRLVVVAVGAVVSGIDLRSISANKPHFVRRSDRGVTYFSSQIESSVSS